MIKPSPGRYVAPIIVSVFRILVLGDLVYIQPNLILQPSLYTLSFWAVVTVTVLFYLRCSLADPGFQTCCPSTWLSEADAKRARALGERLAREELEARRAEESKGITSRLRKMAAQSSSDDEEEDFGLDLSDVSTAGGISVCIDQRPAADHTQLMPGELRRADTPPSRCLWPMVFILRALIKKIVYTVKVGWRPWRVLFKSAAPLEAPTPPPHKLFTLGASSMYQSGEKMHFCAKCHQWKLLRAKHCRSCQRCVRLEDHHCPWLGTCVGERNRVHFVWYLFWQAVELTWVICEGVGATLVRDNGWLNEKARPDIGLDIILPRLGLIVLSVLLVCFLIMCANLFFFHLFLVLSNLTTWEAICWDKISYLKYKPKTYGSPFTQESLAANCELATMPIALSSMSRRKLAAFASTCQIGPAGELIWIARSVTEPVTFSPPLLCSCCNAYEVCL